MASHFSSDSGGVSLGELPKSNVFTSKLPPDPAFETPEASHKAPRETLGPRMVRGALYTYVRPDGVKDTELLGVSPRAMEDLGLNPGEEKTPQFQALVSGNEFYWDEENGGIYPWAQCYGGEMIYRISERCINYNQVGNCMSPKIYQVGANKCSGAWAGQLGDGVRYLHALWR